MSVALRKYLQKYRTLAVLRGPRGGYTLARERRRITLGDVLRVVNEMEAAEDTTASHAALGEQIIAPIWDQMQDQILEHYDAITMEDLYPDPSWNFVFGQASLRDRVGVFSFARYDPAFYGEERGKDYQEILVRRTCKVLAHEIGHMFSLQHCIFFKCVMNGSNHLQESDARPLTLCPVCLRKLQFSIGFDVVDRYRKLLDFYQRAGFDPETQWVARRLKKIVGDDEGK